MLRVSAFACFLILFVSIPTAQSSERIQINEVVPATGIDSLMVNTSRGSISIRGWQRNEIKVVGVADVDSEHLTIATRGHIFVISDLIRTIPMSENKKLGMNLEVYVPAGLKLQLNSVLTNFSLLDIDADATILSKRGSIEIDNYRGNLSMSGIMINSDITRTTGSVAIDTTDGITRINGSRLTALDVQTANGDIIVAGSAKKSHLVSGTGLVEATLQDVAELNIESQTGSVRAQLRSLANASIAITTHDAPVELALADIGEHDVMLETFANRGIEQSFSGIEVVHDQRSELFYFIQDVSSEKGTVTVTSFAGQIRARALESN